MSILFQLPPYTICLNTDISKAVIGTAFESVQSIANTIVPAAKVCSIRYVRHLISLDPITNFWLFLTKPTKMSNIGLWSFFTMSAPQKLNSWMVVCCNQIRVRTDHMMWNRYVFLKKWFVMQKQLLVKPWQMLSHYLSEEFLTFLSAIKCKIFATLHRQQFQGGVLITIGIGKLGGHWNIGCVSSLS